MVLLINSYINRYILAKSVKHNICYFKYVLKLQLGHSPQWSFLFPKGPTPLWVVGFNPWDPSYPLVVGSHPFVSGWVQSLRSLIFLSGWVQFLICFCLATGVDWEFETLNMVVLEQIWKWLQPHFKEGLHGELWSHKLDKN